jgi:hypothetical protein
VLDDRLDGKDLEWARDHLRRCEACRERVEEFREMLLRVGRLPKAAVGSNAMDEAYTLSVPDRLREDAGIRSFEIAPAETSRVVPPMIDMPASMRPEVTSIPDLVSELEREIFRDEPVQDHPTPLASIPDPIHQTTDASDDVKAEFEPAAEPTTGDRTDALEAEASEEAIPVGSGEGAPEPDPPAFRAVPIDSHQPEEREGNPIPQTETDWDLLLASIANAPEVEPADKGVPELAPAAAAASDVTAAHADEPTLAAEPAAHRNVIFDEEPALSFDEEPEATPPTSPPKSDTAMRLFVGFGAAACVLLAAVLYEGGYFLKTHANPTAAVATARASGRPLPSARASAKATTAPTPAPPAATVLFTLGNGVAGNSVFRIRPGTAVAGYTRLVFDMHGSGLPTMLITQTDSAHVQVIFKDTTVTAAPVTGITSYQVSAVEPGVQTGPDGSFTVDLARPVRVTAFTLAATGSYAWRLVVDLHTA